MTTDLSLREPGVLPGSKQSSFHKKRHLDRAQSWISILNRPSMPVEDCFVGQQERSSSSQIVTASPAMATGTGAYPHGYQMINCWELIRNLAEGLFHLEDACKLVLEYLHDLLVEQQSARSDNKPRGILNRDFLLIGTRCSQGIEDVCQGA